MSEITDADIIAAAGDYLEANGWWRGHLVGPNGRQVCAVGAIIYGQGYTETEYNSDTELRQTVYRVAKKVIKALPQEWPSYCSLEQWNDDTLHGAPNRQSVVDLFRRAEKIELAGFDPDA